MLLLYYEAHLHGRPLISVTWRVCCLWSRKKLLVTCCGSQLDKPLLFLTATDKVHVNILGTDNCKCVIHMCLFHVFCGNKVTSTTTSFVRLNFDFTPGECIVYMSNMSENSCYMSNLTAYLLRCCIIKIHR